MSLAMDWLTVGLRPLERSLDRAAPVQAPWAALAIGANILIRFVVVIVTLSSLWAGPFFDADVQRFSELSVAAGTPSVWYRT